MNMGDDPHDVCLPIGILDVGFVITVGGGNWQSEISWQLLGLDENGTSTVILPVDGGLGYAGTYNEGCPVGCSDPTALNYDGITLEALDDGSCEYPTGCTDPAGDNYNPDAIVDDGSCVCEACAELSMTTGYYGVLAAWQITDASTGEVVCGGGAPEAPYDQYITNAPVLGCVLTDGSQYSLSCDDTYGWGVGWGSSYGAVGLTIEGTTLCADFASGTNMMAYFLYGADGISITDDCGVVDGDGSSCSTHVCEDEYVLRLMDSFGDGWNGNTIALTDCEGNPLTADPDYTLLNGGWGTYEGTIDVCMASGALGSGYIITAGGGYYTSEISWELIAADDVADPIGDSTPTLSGGDLSWGTTGTWTEGC